MSLTIETRPPVLRRTSIAGFVKRASSVATNRRSTTSSSASNSSNSPASSIKDSPFTSPLPSLSSFDEIDVPSTEGVPAFTYDQLDTGKVRYFKLCLNGDDEPLAGRILTTEYEQNDPEYSMDSWGQSWVSDSKDIMKRLGDGKAGYDCVSYAWGPSRPKHWLYLSTVAAKFKDVLQSDIVMDHEPSKNGWIPISANLHAFLAELRRRRQKRFIWIDQICVRQTPEEQATQLPIMRDLYSQAKSVLIWLGQGNEWERYAVGRLPHLIDPLERVNAIHKSRGLDPTDAASFVKAFLPEPSDEFWSAMRTIMKNIYWSRTWCLQEAVVNAQQSKIWLGDKSVDIETFHRLALAAESLDLRTWILTGQKGVPVSHYHGFDALAEIRALRRGYKGAILPAMQRRSVTVPADAVLGMLAMVDQQVAHRIAADVSVPTREIFIKFAKHYLRHETSEVLLNHVSPSQVLEGLPTWIPNLGTSSETFSLGSRWVGRYNPSDEQREQMYRAGGRWQRAGRRTSGIRSAAKRLMGGGNRSPSPEDSLSTDPSKLSIVPDTALLRAPGIYVDTITDVIDCNVGAHPDQFLTQESIRATLEWDAECLSIAEAVLPADADVANIYARTLCANRVNLNPTTYQSLLYDTRGSVDMVTDYLNFRDYMDAAIDLGVDEAPAEMSESTKRYAATLYRVTQNRRFFATAGGRIGLGSSTTQPGDQVAVFLHCPTPYVLREQEGARSHTFQGECYMHGLMYGEAMGMVNRNEASETTFIVE